jgi:anti-sigma B factor antagonist
MQLQLESRALGTVLLVQCSGRMVSGTEVYSLHSYVGDALVKYGEIVLDLSQVAFIDSSGLGALVRLASKARAKGGDLKVCGLQQQARKAMEITNLMSVFETYDSIAEAIMAAYLGSRYSKDKSGDADSRVLCVYDAEDVRSFLTEVLCRAGYNVLPTSNVQDAALLLKVTKAKLVILGWNMRSLHGKPTQNILEDIDPSACLLVLDEHFSQGDPGEAVAKLMKQIRSHPNRMAQHSS